MSDHSASRFSIIRFVPLGVLILAGGLFLALGGQRYLTVGALAEHGEWLRGSVAADGIAGVLVFIVIYSGLVALSVPAAALLSITSGFLFGRRSAPPPSFSRCAPASAGSSSGRGRGCAASKPGFATMRSAICWSCA
jgi:hypothetical protein